MSDYQQMEMPEFPKNGKRVILGVIIGIVLVVVIWKSSLTIGAGEGGVLFKTFGGGVYTEKTYSEGFHIIAPWNKMVLYKTRQQKISESMSVLSSNGLGIDVDLDLQFQPIHKKLPNLYQQKGIEYVTDVVIPAIRSATREVIGRYTPEEIYASKRQVIQDEILEETKKELEKQFVKVNNVLVRDIGLPTKIKNAIEGKLEQEQQSLEYKFKLEKAQKEAEKVKIEAQGKADANRILNASLTPNILQEKGIEATLELAKSPNTKVVVVGGKDGLPLILGNN